MFNVLVSVVLYPRLFMVKELFKLIVHTYLPFPIQSSIFSCFVAPKYELSLILMSCYSLVSFSQLQKQIMDLAVTHFKHLPVTPPPDVLEHIPPELPSFLGNTDAARYVIVIIIRSMADTVL